MLTMNPSRFDERLTGRTRIRIGVERLGFFARRQVMIVEVEEAYSVHHWAGVSRYTRWRDMRPSDLPIYLSGRQETLREKPPPPPEPC